MAQHTHIHVHIGTRDADIKRDSGGRFASTSGINGGDHEHHFRQGEHHEAEARKLSGLKTPAGRAAAEAHLAAGAAHHNASEHLKPGAVNIPKAQAFANEANKHALKAAALRGGHGLAPIPKGADR